MALATRAKIATAALPGELALVQVRVAAPLGQKATAAQPLDLSENVLIFVGIDEPA